jgi:hypothetical protein
LPLPFFIAKTVFWQNIAAERQHNGFGELLSFAPCRLVPIPLPIEKPLKL